MWVSSRYLLIISNLILFWSENIICMILMLLNVLKLVLLPSIFWIIMTVTHRMETVFYSCWAQCSINRPGPGLLAVWWVLSILTTFYLLALLITTDRGVLNSPTVTKFTSVLTSFEVLWLGVYPFRIILCPWLTPWSLWNVPLFIMIRRFPTSTSSPDFSLNS